MTLRPFQIRDVAEVQRAFREGATSVLYQAPTGSGKTHTAAEGVIAPSVAKGRRVVFLAGLEEIVLDTTRRLRAMGLAASAILDGRAEDLAAPVQVASQQTLVSWVARGVDLPPADRVILDECRCASAETLTALLSQLRARGALLLGLDATPARGDGQGLGAFERLVCGPRISDLIAAGHLVRPVVFSPSRVLDALAEDPAAVVRERLRGRRAVVFATSQTEATRIAHDLTAAGEPALAVLASTPKAERRRAAERIEAGDLHHLVTVDALKAGFDCPRLDAVVLGGLYSSVSDYLQICGRGGRTRPGKADCLIYDLRGSVYLHGLPDADRVWSLEGEQGKPRSAPGLRRCADCHAIFEPSARCPRCGSALVSDPRPVRVQRAELHEQQRGTEAEIERAREALRVGVLAIQRHRPHWSTELCEKVYVKRAPAWVRSALGVSRAA